MSLDLAYINGKIKHLSNHDLFLIHMPFLSVLNVHERFELSGFHKAEWQMKMCCVFVFRFDKAGFQVRLQAGSERAGV